MPKVGNSQKSSEIDHIMLILKVITVRPSAFQDTGTHSGGEVTASVERNWKVNYCVYRWDITEPVEFSSHRNTLVLYGTF